MDEKEIQDFKNSILVVKEIRDRTKSISELADKLVRACEDPVYALEIIAEVEHIPTQIQAHFMILTAFINTMGETMGEEKKDDNN